MGTFGHFVVVKVLGSIDWYIFVNKFISVYQAVVISTFLTSSTFLQIPVYVEPFELTTAVQLSQKPLRPTDGTGASWDFLAIKYYSYVHARHTSNEFAMY